LPRRGKNCEGQKVRSPDPHLYHGPAVFAPERRRSLLLNAVIVASAACGSPDAGVSVSVRDSAGVVIVTNTASAEAPLQSIMIASEPSTAIETNEERGQVPFFRVGGSTKLPSGEIIVGDADALDVRVFDPSGAFLRSFGGSGRGPGELTSIAGVAHWGDTIVVYDASRATVMFFDVDGRSIGQRRVHAASRHIRDLHRFADDTWVARGFLRPGDALPPVEGAGRRIARIVTLAVDGGEVATVGRFPDAYTNSEVVQRRGDLTFVEDRPVAFTPRVTFVAGGAELFVGTAESYEILVLNQSGKLVRMIRRTVPIRKATRGEREAVADRAAQRASSSEAAREAREWILAHARDEVPPYSRIMLDATGLLWVAEYPILYDAPTWWAVYDPHGGLLGDVRMPHLLDVLQIGRDFVLGVRRDAYGRESLYVYDLQRRAR
jgi:hypothetical protein